MRLNGLFLFDRLIGTRKATTREQHHQRWHDRDVRYERPDGRDADQHAKPVGVVDIEELCRPKDLAHDSAIDTAQAGRAGFAANP